MPSGTLQPFNPLVNVARFVRQPRLRLARMVAPGPVFGFLFMVHC
jgi:hypothetical protein